MDLRNLGSFEELFYLVVLEKNKDCGSTLHMWKMTIASQAGTVGEGMFLHPIDCHLLITFANSLDLDQA